MFRLPFIIFGLAAFSGVVFASIVMGRAPRALGTRTPDDDPHADEAGAEFTVRKLHRNLEAA